MDANILFGFTIPFLGTLLGAAAVFLFRRNISDITQKAMLGFASGVMVAASFWSLLLPAINLSVKNSEFMEILPILIGFLSGMGFLFMLDTFIPHQHIDSTQSEGPGSSLSRSTKLMLAVTLHNIPEGMAVGVVFAGMHSGETTLTLAAAFALAIGMAVQNVPEGAIISMPLRAEGVGRGKTFLYGTLSGIVEPIAATVTLLFLEYTVPAMPFLLAFSAGAMLYVVVEELIPASQQGKHSNIGTIGFALGFALMMVLDVILG
ncbi:MAG: ZIP family metal transporter [Bacteroidales bacterium]|nr:ZIP family metal transporter [Bacteroidales bacterium]MBR2607694.1 ZIP family metal transporter [Bacteroidaceae bacterium]